MFPLRLTSACHGVAATRTSMNSHTLTLVISIALAAGSAFSAATEPSLDSPDWKLRNPSPTGDLLPGVVAGPAGFLALSSNGTLFHSANGAFWSPLAVFRSQYIHARRLRRILHRIRHGVSHFPMPAVAQDHGAGATDGLVPFIVNSRSGNRWVALDRPPSLRRCDTDHVQFPGREHPPPRRVRLHCRRQ
jgi:hypothetical protein